MSSHSQISTTKAIEAIEQAITIIIIIIDDSKHFPCLRPKLSNAARNREAFAPSVTRLS
jgi:hypothetical protein